MAVLVGMEVRKLYIVKDGSTDLDMLLTACLLHPFDYKLRRATCGGREVDVRAAYHEECIDEVEFEVARGEHTKTLYDVMDDLYRLDGTERVDLFNMIFVAEADSGEYIEFSINDVRNFMWEEFAEVEEELEEESEDEGFEEELEDVVEVEEL